MLSQMLLNEIMSCKDVYDRCNIYESGFFVDNAKSVKKDYLQIRKSLEQYIKETTSDNIGKNMIKIIL